MQMQGWFDDESQIEVGVKRQSGVKKAKGAQKATMIAERVPKYKFNYSNADRGGVKNFIEGSRPYGNNSHHVLPCEFFYDQYGWTAERLTVAKECGYDINNEENILYLPNSYRGKISISCYYHDLPNHAYDHGRYNEVVGRHVRKILKKIDKAIDDEECSEEDKDDLMWEIYQMFTQIEDKYFEVLINKGPSTMHLN